MAESKAAIDGMYGRRRSPGRLLARAALYGVALLVAAIAVFPFYWMLAGSLMTPVELYSNIPHLWPAHANLDAYKRVWEMVPIARYFINSIVTSTATLALLTFTESWDQLLWPLIIATRPDMRTLQVGLAFISQTLPTINYQLAAITLSVIPVIVAFLLAQRQFIEGIAAGGVKE